MRNKKILSKEIKLTLEIHIHTQDLQSNQFYCTYSRQSKVAQIMLHESARTTEEPITDGWRYICIYYNEAIAVYIFTQSLEYYLIFLLFIFITYIRYYNNMSYYLSKTIFRKLTSLKGLK